MDILFSGKEIFTIKKLKEQSDKFSIPRLVTNEYSGDGASCWISSRFLQFSADKKEFKLQMCVFNGISICIFFATFQPSDRQTAHS